MISSDEGGRDGGGRTQIDRGIKVHVDPLIGQGGADNDGLSGFQNPFPDPAGILLGHHGGDVGFDSTGTKTHDEDGDDQATERGAGVLESGRGGGTSKNRVTNPRREIDARLL